MWIEFPEEEPIQKDKTSPLEWDDELPEPVKQVLSKTQQKRLARLQRDQAVKSEGNVIAVDFRAKRRL